MKEKRIAKLDICTELFGDFHDQRIKYCHWKSNEHLREGLVGVTDLDIIVERRQEVAQILSQNDFKRFEPAWFVGYTGVEDYLGYDTESGTLVHLHLHYRLAIGNKRLKDYNLPWVDTLLRRRVFDEEFQVYRADPEMEMCLLLIRYALKIQARDYVKSIFREYLGENIIREYDWLQERIDRGEVINLTADLLNEEAATVIDSMLKSKPKLSQFRKLRKICADELSDVRTYGYLEAKGRGFLREIFLGFRSLNERYFSHPRFYRRTVPSGGVIIVLIGVDGAGKSTVIEELKEWLSWKIDEQYIYYGSGEGSATLLRYPLILARQWVGETDGGVGQSTEDMSHRSLFLRVGRVVRGLVLARERQKKLEKGWRARNRGLVVLGDRYPQNQVMGFNDGPLLNHLSESSSKLLRYLKQYERDVYQSATDNPPDLVITLDVSSETANARKPEMPLEQFKKRKAAIDRIEYDTKQHVVDAEQPIEEVIREVKQLVWEQL
jgi:hypothetical protein